MGQLEKYGLYVLCLVIFLILGVTIWGEPADALKKTNSENVAMRANALGIEPKVPTATPASASGPAMQGNPNQGSPNQDNPNRPLSNATGGDPEWMDSWLKPGARPPKPARTGGNTAGNTKKPKPVAIEPPVEKRPAVNKRPAINKKPAATTRKYIVKRGDTLGEIAQRQLGSTRYMTNIRALNPRLDERHLQVGKPILLPVNVGGKTPAVVSNGSYRTYTISSGDTFERIARIELGSPKRVKELIKLNSSVDPLRLIPGKKIKLPRK